MPQVPNDSLRGLLHLPDTLAEKTRQRGKEGSWAFCCGPRKGVAAAAVPESSLQACSSADITCDSAVLPAPKGACTRQASPETWMQGAKMEDAALAGDALATPSGRPLTQLCSGSSRTTALFGSRSFQSQLSGGAHLNGSCSGNTELKFPHPPWAMQLLPPSSSFPILL